MSDVPDWPASGAVPVFTGSEEAPELVGYTTLIMEWYPKVSRFMMSRKADEEGAMTLCGEARVIERITPAGDYLAWLVLSGDPQDMPDFWKA